MSSLSNRLDSFAEAWKPKPGDTLIGVVIGLDKRTSTYNPSEPYAIVSIQVEDGSTEDGGTAIPVGEDRAWHGFDTVVRNELRSSGRGSASASAPGTTACTRRADTSVGAS